LHDGCCFDDKKVLKAFYGCPIFLHRHSILIVGVGRAPCRADSRSIPVRIGGSALLHWKIPDLLNDASSVALLCGLPVMLSPEVRNRLRLTF
jgi:hypothetical protein